MKLPCKITITRPSNNTHGERIEITLQDSVSGVRFFRGEMTAENFALVITGLGYTAIEGDLRGLENVGKKKVSEPRSIPEPEGVRKTEDQEKWIAENCKEDGWIVDPFLGTQHSRDYNGALNRTILHYRVFKYVEVEPDPEEAK